MRIFLADDQARVRSALRLLLEQEPGLDVVGEAVDAEELLVKMKAAQPDLVLLDWELPGLARPNAASSKAQLLLVLHKYHRDLRVVVLSGHLEARQAALAAGADAFVSKGDPPDFLLATMRAMGLRNKRRH